LFAKLGMERRTQAAAYAARLLATQHAHDVSEHGFRDWPVGV
jgi:hypothetical protein